MRRRYAVAAWAVATFIGAVRAEAGGCEQPLDAQRVIACALSASPQLRQERARLDALAGRLTATSAWLPTGPVVAASLAHRRRPAPEAATALNWNVTLSQELEIGGQRRRRLDVVDAEAAAQVRRVAVAEQEIAAAALHAWFAAAAAHEALAVAIDLENASEALAQAVEGRAKEGVVAGVEADVVRAEAVRVAAARLEAQHRLDDARAELSSWLGVMVVEVAPAVPDGRAVYGDGDELEARALRLRGDVAAAEVERQVLERRVALVRRGAVPNVTVSAFAERAEVNDRIFGVGLSVPLPQPKARSGAVAEASADLRAAEQSVELVRRRVRLEVAQARAGTKAADAALALYRPDLIARARAHLAAIKDSLLARQLSVREALSWQRGLMDLLRANVEARLAQRLAQIELRRVVGEIVGGQS